MARVTSDRAVEAIGNRYELVLIASRRVRELGNGHTPKVDCKNTPVVTSLREIEAGHIGRDYLSKPQNLDRKKTKS